MEKLIDLIYDVKEKITDQEYRDIMDGLAIIHNQLQNGAQTDIYRDSFSSIVSEPTEDVFGQSVRIKYTDDIAGCIDIVFKKGADFIRTFEASERVYTIQSIDIRYNPSQEEIVLPILNVCYDREGQQNHLIESASFDQSTLTGVCWSDKRPNGLPTQIVYASRRDENITTEIFGQEQESVKRMQLAHDYGTTVETYDHNNKLHCINNEPSKKTYNLNGQLKVAQYHDHGTLQYEIEYNADGSIRHNTNYENPPFWADFSIIFSNGLQ